MLAGDDDTLTQDPGCGTIPQFPVAAGARLAMTGGAELVTTMPAGSVSPRRLGHMFLHLPIRARGVWAGELVRRPGVLQGVVEDLRAVCRTVVCQAALDGRDAVLAVEQHTAEPEPGSGGGSLVGVDFGVGQAAVVIDSRMDVEVPRSVVRDPSRGSRLVGAMSVDAQPPPSGMRPTFFTSMWSISPGAGCSYRRGSRLDWPVGMSRSRSREMP